MKAEDIQNEQVQMLGQSLARKRELTQAEIEEVAGGMRSVKTWCPTSGVGWCIDAGWVD
jgi:hypothetical protein